MESLVDEDHAERLRKSLVMLCNNKNLCDVVLTSTDGCDMQAHWLVLATSSEYFAAMNYSPIIYTDMDISELSIIVNYIYTGKVSIIPDKKDKLLLGCRKLKLSSLETLILSAQSRLQSTEAQGSPDLLNAWTKHHKRGSGISSGHSADGSREPPGGDQSSVPSTDVVSSIGYMFESGQNMNSASTSSTNPASVTPSHRLASASNTSAFIQPSSSSASSHPVQPYQSSSHLHPVAWSWDPEQAGDSNQQSLVENVDFHIKEEVMSDEEQGYNFFAPADDEDELSQNERSSAMESPGGKKGRKGGGMKGQMAAETVGRDSGEEEDTADKETTSAALDWWKKMIRMETTPPVGLDLTASRTVKRTRHCVTAGEKREICIYKEQNPSASMDHISKYFERTFGHAIGKSTVSDILKYKEKWLAISDDCANLSRARNPKHQHLEEILVLWINDLASKNLSVNDAMIIEKAQFFGAHLGISDFSYSRGWLYRFKSRHSLSKKHNTVKQTI